MIRDCNAHPENNVKNNEKTIYIYMYVCMYVCMYYQCHENGVCRNGFDGFRLYHDSTIWDSLKRSRRFHTITCRGLFQRRSQTVSDGLRLYPFFRLFWMV